MSSLDKRGDRQAIGISTDSESSVSKISRATKLTFEYDVDTELWSDYICPICLDPAHDALIEVQCERLFCGPCIQSCSKCPVCTKPIENLCRPPLAVRNTLQKIKVKCTCGEVMTREEYAKHKTSYCKLRVCPCPCESYGCPVKDVADKMNAHLSKCLFQKHKELFIPLSTKYEDLLVRYERLTKQFSEIASAQSDELEKKNSAKVCGIGGHFWA